MSESKLKSSEDQLKQVKANFKTITEIERILTECIRIGKDNSHMINETCSHVIEKIYLIILNIFKN